MKRRYSISIQISKEEMSDLISHTIYVLKEEKNSMFTMTSVRQRMNHAYGIPNKNDTLGSKLFKACFKKISDGYVSNPRNDLQYYFKRKPTGFLYTIKRLIKGD